MVTRSRLAKGTLRTLRRMVQPELGVDKSSVELAVESAWSSLDASLVDHVTQIGNRRFFEQKLDLACRGQGVWSALLMLDLDRFKVVNDTLGHAAGDALLCRVAERMHGVLGPDDVMARLGGDEFGMLLSGVENEAQTTEIARRLIDLVQRTYLIEGQPVNIGVSIGIVRGELAGKERVALLRSADLALYCSKNAGRGCFSFFDPSMATRAETRRSMELELRRAMVLRQFELHYKPQVDVATQRLTGFDAMLRWRHPKRGLLEAAAFMPLAEEIGLVEAIGEWVLRSASREATRWAEGISISIQVSPLLFESTRFVGAIERALAGAGIPGSKLELEVSEAVLLRDEVSVTATVQSIRALGVHVSIGSFGTGVASLSQVVNFPITRIKIDRSLVNLMNTGVKERAIVRAIAALGASLGLSTLVDGIATLDHLTAIQRDGCNEVQGYFESKAFSSADLSGAVLKLMGGAEAMKERGMA